MAFFQYFCYLVHSSKQQQYGIQCHFFPQTYFTHVTTLSQGSSRSSGQLLAFYLDLCHRLFRYAALLYGQKKFQTGHISYCICFNATLGFYFSKRFFWGWDQFKNFACWTGRLKKNFLLAPFANSLFHSAHCTGANNYVCAWSSLKSIEGLLLSLGIFHD